jgi:hypothetical protein
MEEAHARGEYFEHFGTGTRQMSSENGTNKKERQESRKIRLTEGLGHLKTRKGRKERKKKKGRREKRKSPQWIGWQRKEQK